MVLHHVACYSIISHGISCYFMILHCLAFCYLPSQCMVWFCLVLHGVAWYCITLHCFLWYCMLLNFSYFPVMWCKIYILHFYWSVIKGINDELRNIFGGRLSCKQIWYCIHWVIPRHFIVSNAIAWCCLLSNSIAFYCYVHLVSHCMLVNAITLYCNHSENTHITFGASPRPQMCLLMQAYWGCIWKYTVQTLILLCRQFEDSLKNAVQKDKQIQWIIHYNRFHLVHLFQVILYFIWEYR